MAELRCLVCNNVNPDNAESCQFCGARLRQPTVPLGPIKAGEAPTKKDTSDLEGTLPSWLRDLRSEGAAESGADSSAMKSSGDLFADKKSAPPPSKPKAQAPSPADFLAGLSSAASDDEDEVPDWLASIRPPEAPAPSEPAAQPPAAGPADWMSGLRADAEPAKAQEPEPVDFGFASSGNWLDAPAEKPAPAEETSEDVADWLRTLDQGPTTPPAQPTAPQAPAPAAFPAADAGVPDWLSGLEHTSAIPGASANIPPAQPAAPDWLSDLETPASQTAPQMPTPAAESAPDWLSSLADETPAQPTAAAPASDMPDWLSDLSAPSAPTPSAPAPTEAAPDWLSSLGEPATPLPSEAAPDWLSSLGEPETPAAPSPAEAAPDWRSGLDEPLTPAVPADAIPDWMRGSMPVEPAAQESEPELPTFEAPSWLSEESETPAAETALPAQDMPAWLSNLSGTESAAPETVNLPPAPSEPVATPRTKATAFVMDENIDAGDAEALLSMDMPDWLSGMAPAEASTPSAPSAVEPAEPTAALSDSELPSWVQAMRPVESMVDASGPAEGGYVEEQGPLAGLRDVLPGASGLLATPKPRAYANRLQLSDSHQAQTSMLEALIAAEAAPKPLTTQKQMGSARVLRWVLAALVLLAVAVPVFMGTQTVPTIDGRLLLGQSVAMYKAVDALQPNDPVLLVFDYEAGLSGELEAASMPVIEHMKLKGARLIAISTSPSGPLLAERVFAKLQSDQFKTGEQYTNLGYLAGNVTGIASFAAAPQQATPFDNAKAWSSRALENVTSYDSFAAVVIITDNADIGRAWIEQTASRLNGKPMLLIASAQAEPMLWPYTNSQQVKGMVSGLSGGAFYEVQTGQFKLGRAYWDAFSYAFMLAEIALVIGGLWSLIAHFRARKTEEDEV